MRYAVFILAAAGLIGCQAKRQSPPPVVEARVYAPRTTGTLLFDPPASLYEPMPSFARADREPSLFVGYESQITETLFIDSYDRQTSGYGGFGYFGGRGGYGDRLDRRTYVTRSAVLTR